MTKKALLIVTDIVLGAIVLAIATNIIADYIDIPLWAAVIICIAALGGLVAVNLTLQLSDRGKSIILEYGRPLAVGCVLGVVSSFVLIRVCGQYLGCFFQTFPEDLQSAFIAAVLPAAISGLVVLARKKPGWVLSGLAIAVILTVMVIELWLTFIVLPRNPDGTYRNPQCTLTPTPVPAPTVRPTNTLTTTATEAPTSMSTPALAPPTEVQAPEGPPVPASLGVTWVRPVDGMVMVSVPSGEFKMGSSDDEIDYELQLCNEEYDDCRREWFESEQPVHTVYLDGFWIDQTEITNAQYQRCVESGTCDLASDSSSFTRDSYYGNSAYDDYPVVHVSWRQAADYCRWIGGRLPTEAEWEYAARGPYGSIFPWGNRSPDNTLLNYNGNVGDTVEVGSYPNGMSWCGALDMAGNAWEWMNDWYGYDYYGRSPPKNPTGPPSGECRGLRGGNWSSNRKGIRAAQRDYYTPDWSPLYLVGLRCVMSPGE